MENTANRTENDTVAELATQAAREPRTLPISRGTPDQDTVLLVPEGDGFALKSVKEILDANRTVPPFRKGISRHSTLESFVAHVKRNKDSDSSVFVGESEVVAIYDYHLSGLPGEGKARNGLHRATYAFPFSDELKYWKQINGTALSQTQLATILEERFADLKDPATCSGSLIEEFAAQFEEGKKCYATPSRLMTLGRGLEIKANLTAKEVINQNTGERSIEFSESHESNDSQGKPERIPHAFVIAIPVFKPAITGGAVSAYQLPVRLRYKLTSGKVTWSVTIHRLDLAILHAKREEVVTIQSETGLPVFEGSPE